MVRLLLVRHGAVSGDGAGRYFGHTDVALTDQGTQQARMLRLRLASENITAVYSSDLRRALDTAIVIAEPRGLRVTPLRDLREINFGEFEGMTFSEVQAARSGADKLWSGADPDTPFPGGESPNALARRVDRAVEKILADSPEGTVLLVAHGGSLRVLVCRMMGINACQWWRIRIDIASLTVLDVYPEGTALSLLNDVCHLRETA